MFVKLNTVVTQQDLRLFQMGQNLKEASAALEEKIERESSRHNMLHNKLENKINDGFRKMNMSLTEVTEKIEAKNRAIENEVSNLRSKVGRV